MSLVPYQSVCLCHVGITDWRELNTNLVLAVQSNLLIKIREHPWPFPSRNSARMCTEHIASIELRGLSGRGYRCVRIVQCDVDGRVSGDQW